MAGLSFLRVVSNSDLSRQEKEAAERAAKERAKNALEAAKKQAEEEAKIRDMENERKTMLSTLNRRRM